LKSNFSLILVLLPVLAGAQTTLDEALGKARLNRASVQAAELRLTQARLARRAFGAFPATNLSVGYSNDVRVGGNDDDLVLSQPLDIFGRSAAGREAGNALVVQAESSLRQTLADLQDDVVVLYAETAAAAGRIRVAQESEDAAARLLDAVKALVDGGKLPGIQATRVAIELERVSTSRQLREAELNANKKRLAAAIGVTSDSLAIDAFPAIAVTAAPVGDLVKQRPDLMTLNADVQTAEAEIRMARAERMPTLELQGRRSSWHDGDATYGARIQLSFPLFDSGRGRSEVDASRKRAEAARRNLDDATKIAEADVEAARIEVDSSREQVAKFEALRKKTQGLVEVTQVGLKEGANTLLDVLDAMRAAREIDESIVESKLALAQAEARLLKATGQIIEVKK